MNKKSFIPGKRYTSGSIVYVADERGDLVRVMPTKRDLRAKAKYLKAMRKVVEDNHTTPSAVQDETSVV